MFCRVTQKLEKTHEVQENMTAILNHRASVILELVTHQKALSDQAEFQKDHAIRLGKLLISERKRHMGCKETKS